MRLSKLLFLRFHPFTFHFYVPVKAPSLNVTQAWFNPFILGDPENLLNVYLTTIILFSFFRFLKRYKPVKSIASREFHGTLALRLGWSTFRFCLDFFSFFLCCLKKLYLESLLKEKLYLKLLLKKKLYLESLLMKKLYLESLLTKILHLESLLTKKLY